jgi:uncharacterized protein YukE
MAVIGGEVEQLAALKALFDRQSAMIGEIVSSIRSQMGNTYWEGPAAQRFRGDWQSTHESQLQRLQTQLTECATEVSRRREMLIRAGS